MLREIARVRQHDPQLRRRWSRDDYFDVFTWQETDGCFAGFHLCYGLPADARVLSWRESAGYAHHRVDGGERFPVKNMTPIMAPDGLITLCVVPAAFDRRDARLDPAVRVFVRERCSTTPLEYRKLTNLPWACNVTSCFYAPI